jgi:hypothetical protein
MRTGSAPNGAGAGTPPSRMGVVGPVVTRRIGLQVSRALSFDEWNRIGMQLSLIADSSAWWLGDWLVYGEIHFAKRYQHAIAKTSLEYQTLRNYAWVVRRFPMSRRRDELSFQHHAEVAGLPEREQDEWLERACAGRWSRNQLRARLRESRKLGPSPADPPDPAVLRLSVSAERQRRWALAAEAAEQTLDEWAAQTLDLAASHLLAVSASAVPGSADTDAPARPRRSLRQVTG